MLRAALCTFAFATIALGCATKEPTPTGEGSQEKGCASGATQNAEGGFCLNLPPDLENGAPAGGDGRYEYAAGGSAVTVLVKTGSAASEEQWAAAKKDLADQVTRLGGSSRAYGPSISGTWKESDGRTAATTLLRSDGKILECRAVSTSAAALQACQTLRAL